TVFIESTMGTKINAQTNENSPYVQSVKKMGLIIPSRCLSPLKLFDATFWLTKDYYTQKKALKVLHDFTWKIISSKKREEFDTIPKKMAFLELMLTLTDDDKKKLSLDEIRQEVDTFMFEVLYNFGDFYNF